MDIRARKGLLVELSRLSEMLGFPQVNGDVSRDWSELEEGCGFALPDDYKEFVSAYGPGCINEQLYLFHPRATRGEDGLRLDMLWQQASFAYGELSLSHPEMYPYPVHPVPGDVSRLRGRCQGITFFLGLR